MSDKTRILSNYPDIPTAINFPPQGRLTLTSNTPVMTADATAQTTVYYTPYIGNIIPIYNGTLFIITPFIQLSLSLDNNSGHTGYQQSGNLFDLFVFNNSGTITLATGPAWTNSTTRANAISSLNGVWTNTSTITLKIDATSTTVSVNANQATYVGTMYATANGQTGMAFRPTPVAGGSNPILGLWNAYNRIATSSQARDSTVNWTYATATWRASDGNNNNRVSYVDGLGQSFVRSLFAVYVQLSGGVAPNIGSNLNSTTATPATSAIAGISQPMSMADSFYPTQGFNFIQAMEYSSGGTSTFWGMNVFQTHELRIDLEM